MADYTATKQVWDSAKLDLDYAGGTDEYREAYKQSFAKHYPLGSQVIGEEEAQDDSYVEQVGTQAKQGLFDTISAIRVAGDAKTGSTNVAGIVAKDTARKSGEITPTSFKATQAMLAAETKRYNLAKTTEDKFISIMRTAIATGEEIVENPAGVGLLAARSIPNIIAPIAGAGIGSLTGSPAGTITGMLAGSYTVEEGAAIEEGITKELESRKLPVTKENVQTIIDDKEVYGKIKSGAARKAAGTAITDTLLSAGIGKVASAAKKASKARNAAVNVGAAVAEGVSEPGSELVGQKFRGTGIDVGELAGEFLGGIGSGPIMAPVDIAVFGAKKLTELTEKEAPKKSWAKAPTQHKYKEQVKERVESEDIADIADPESDKFNPVMAVETLQKISNKEEVTPLKQIQNREEADRVFNALQDHRQELIKEYQTIASKEELTEEDGVIVDALITEITDTKKTLETIHPLIKSMGTTAVDQKEVLKQINEAVGSNEDQKVRDTILSVFGSRRGSDLTDNKALTDILDNPEIGEEVKQQVRAVQAYQEVEKSMDDVTTDIIEGSPGKRGIKDYSQAVTVALQANDTDTANTQLDMLKTFADRHKTKADTFTQVYNAYASGKEPSTNLSTLMEGYNQERIAVGNKAYNLNTPNARKLVETIGLEADALNNAVNMLTSFITPTALTETETLSEGEVIDATAGSGATERASTVATAKEEEIEGSTRTAGVSKTTKEDKVAGKVKAKKTKTKPEPTKETDSDTVKSLKGIGLRESEIERLSPSRVPLLLKYGNMTKKELKEARKDVLPKSEDAIVIKNVIALKERSQLETRKEEVIIPSLNEELSTQDINDPANKVKETVEPKKVKGLLQNAPNAMDVLDPEILKDSGIFDENNPMDKEAVAVIESINKFSDKFNPAFEKEYRASGADTVGRKTYINIASQLSVNKGLKKQFIAQLYEQMPDGNYSDLQVLDIIDKGTFNKEVLPKYRERINKRITNTFDARENNPIEYLASTNKILPENVVNALMAASYKWVASRSSETVVNYQEQLEAILGLNEDAYISRTAYDLLADVGVTSTMLQESLGQEVFNLLGIKVTDRSDYDLQNRLEISLGLQAIATMQSMGILTQKNVLNGANPNNPYGATKGLAGLRNSLKDDSSIDEKELRKSFFVTDETPYSDYADAGFTPFYRIVTTEDNKYDEGLYTDYVEPFKESKNTWDRLFKGENDKKNYSFEPIKESKKPSNMKGTNIPVSEEQQANVNKNQKSSYGLSRRTTGIFMLFDDENKGKIQGAIDPATVHAERDKTVLGVNRGIQRSNERLEDWLIEASKRDEGLDSKFYTPWEFWRQGRMGQVGDINLQGDKNHRFLFGMSAWNKEIDLTNPDMVEQFLAAIALGFDIETSKVGGMKQTITKLNKKLENEKIQKGLDAIKTITDGVDMTNWTTEQLLKTRGIYTDEIDAITDAVLVGEMNVHSLKALIEYQRYREAVANEETSFTTDIPNEVDGVSNGILISRTQLTTDAANKAETLTALQNGGYSFTDDPGGLAEHLASPLSQDAYQATGFTWTGALVDIEYEITQKIANSKVGTAARSTAVKELKQLSAMKALFGEFRDSKSGEVLKIARKLSKGPTMQTSYGMLDTTLLKQLRDTFVLNIYEKLESIVAGNDVDALRILNQQMKDVTGTYLLQADAVTGDNINREVVLTATFSKEQLIAIKESIDKHHGRALSSSIDKIYGGLKEAFKGLNGGIGISAVLYNSVLKLRIEQAEIKAASEGRKISVGEVNQIKEDLKDMYPYVKTPFGGRIPLTKESKEKNYNIKAEGVRNQEVQQQYHNLPGKKGAPYRVNGASAPGVGGTVVNVHNQDSVIANILMGMYEMLNNHDGVTAGVGVLRNLGTDANDIFFSTMSKYDMGAEIASAVNSVVDQFSECKKQLLKEGVLEDQITLTLINEFEAMRIFNYQPPGAPMIPLEAANYEEIMKYYIADMDRVAVETAKNKDAILSSVTRVEQYSYPGAHYDTGNSAQTIEFATETFDPATITDEAERRLIQAKESTDVIGKLIAKDRETFIDVQGSSATSARMSTDPNDYQVAQEISSMNMLEMYENIKDDSTVTDSAAHDAHLQDILKTVIQNVLNPINVFLTSNPDIEPEGKFVPAENSVFISSQNSIVGPLSGALTHGIRMSTGEVYTHELLHSVLHVGLLKNKRLRDRVEQLFDIAKKDLDYKAFLTDPNTTNQFEIEAAKERYDYVFRNVDTIRYSEFADGINTATQMENYQERSNYLDEFITLALTNEQFNNSLSRIELTGTEYKSTAWKGIIGANIQETLGNIAQVIMNFFYKKFSSNVTAATMDKELKNLAIILSNKDSDQKSQLYNAVLKAGQYTSKVSTYGNEYVKKAVKALPLVKGMEELRNNIAKVKASDTIVGQRLREVEYAYQRLSQGITKTTIDEMKGRTSRVAWLYEMISRRQIFLDQAKQTEVETYINEANRLFSRELTTEEKTAITKAVLKTDLSALDSLLSIDEIAKVIKDPKELQNQIDNVMTKIDKDFSAYSSYYHIAADGLGYLMNHSRKRADDPGFMSTRVIASLRNTGLQNNLTEVQIDQADMLVDQLASLYAIKYAEGTQKNIILGLIEEDPKSITGVMGLHKVLKDNSLEGAFGGNKYKFTKGYTKQILNSRMDVRYGTLQDKDVYLQQGYRIVEKPLMRDPEDGMKNEPIHMYVSRNARVNDLQSTILSYTGNIARGSDFTEVARNLGWGLDASAIGKAHTVNMVRKGKEKIAAITQPGHKFDYSTDDNYMIPLVDDQGNISQYRYMMSEVTKDNYMEQITEFDKILGAMAGQVVDKVRSPIINRELVTGLHEVFKEGYKKNPAGFVEISMQSGDERLREIYSMIPAKTKKDIKAIWGTNMMLVPKDFIDLSFGYRQYSITEAFTKKPEDRKNIEKMVVAAATAVLGENAAGKIGTMETLAKELTKVAKSNIIIKSLHVTLGNLGSNLIYLKSRGVPVAKIARLGWEAIAYGNKYQIDAKKLNNLQLRKEALLKGSYTQNQLKELDSRIARIKTAISLNPVTKSIESGLMPSLIDDVETVTSGTNFPTEFEKKVTEYTEKLHPMVQNVGKVILLTEDTQAYKALNNAVKMTDFIGRHVLYTHYTSEGVAHKEAVAKVEDEFVNFNVPTHKMIEYGNQIGVLWFTKYGLRILKVIKDSIVDKPFDVFMAYMLSTHAGADNILNSVPGVTKDVFSPFGLPTDVVGTINEILPINTAEAVIDEVL